MIICLSYVLRMSNGFSFEHQGIFCVAKSYNHIASIYFINSKVLGRNPWPASNNY